MGHYAVELIAAGKSNRVVGVKKNDIIDYDIHEALSMKEAFEEDLYKVATDISF
jgi:6-phosphofructokinase 1